MVKNITKNDLIKVADSAFDEIKEKKIEEGQSEEQAKESAGKILSAAKGKRGSATKKKEPSKLKQLEVIKERYGHKISYFDLPALNETIENLKKNPKAEIPEKVTSLSERYEKYNELAKKLPKLEIPKNTPNQQKYQELMKKAKEIKFFEGREMEGVNLSQAAQQSSLEKEAQQYCEHEFKTKYDADYTGDARKKLTRTIECKKCRKKYTHTVSENLSKEAMWR